MNAKVFPNNHFSPFDSFGVFFVLLVFFSSFTPYLSVDQCRDKFFLFFSFVFSTAVTRWILISSIRRIFFFLCRHFKFAQVVRFAILWHSTIERDCPTVIFKSWYPVKTNERNLMFVVLLHKKKNFWWKKNLKWNESQRKLFDMFPTASKYESLDCLWIK